MSNPSIRRGLAALAAAGSLLLAALAVAPQADAATIYACVKKKSGNARIVSKQAKCKKGETKLSWNTVGPAGKDGLNGASGKEGATGKEGPMGVKGLGVIASNTSNSFSCTLSEFNNYCYESGLAFTPSANAQCLVSVFAQIEGLTPGKPTIKGPYFRIAIQENGSSKNDGDYGFYFEGTSGPESTQLSRTRLISVKAGTKYNFGTYFGEPSGEWENTDAESEVTYFCF